MEHTIDEEGVVAAFPELHHGVHQVRNVGRPRPLGQEAEVFL